MLSHVSTYRMNARSLEFPNPSFDGVYSFSTLQYIDVPELAAQEIYGVLKPGCAAYLDIHLCTSMGVVIMR